MESKFESLWIDTTPSTNYPPLERVIETDVVVVGGGIAGLVTAYYLQAAGKKVVVVEAENIVTGTTGFTTAKVTLLHDLKYAFLKQHFGLEKTKIYAESNQWAVEALEEIIKKEKIECGFQRVCGFLYSNEEKYVKELEDEQQVLQEIGVPATLEKNVNGQPFAIKAAVRVCNQATFHPRKFLLQLAEKITQREGFIFENSRVTKVSDGSSCTVETDQGKVIAKQVVVATNYPIIDTSVLFLRMDQMRSYALAITTEDEVSDDMFVGLGKDEVTVRTYHEQNKRWVIIGGESHPAGETAQTDEKYQRLKKLTEERFSVKTIEYQWSAQDAAPLDRVPLTGKMPNQKNVFVTTGYGEWGMTSSIMSARLLTDLITDQANPWQELYDPGRLNVTAAAGRSVELGKQVAKGFGSYLTRHDDTDISTMQPGEGRVITRRGEKVAVSKNKEGKVCALSAVCTHMGCIVEWNTAEESWDCPCHGSRFTNEGEVIHGPAVKPLKKK